VAERFGLKQKGGIEVGKDADFVMVDLNEDAIVQCGDLCYRHRHTPYLGRKLRARIVRTVLRGQTIFQDGKFVSEQRGQFVRPL
jgi:allantoinase